MANQSHKGSSIMFVIDKVKNTIDKYELLEIGDKVLVGVSGGPDSLTLLHILKRLKDEYDLSLHIAHLDHMFRGERSAKDARFVKRLASRWGIPITLKEYDVGEYQKKEGLSAEDAARKIRYKFFFDLIDELDFDKIAVGHNLNDQAETVLMKFLRGAGLKGLGGIAPIQGSIIRPLINIKREMIEEYCQKKDLNPRIDATNKERVYLRNKIRLDLIPLLEDEYNDNLVSTLSRTADILRDEEKFLKDYTIRVLDKLIINQNKGRIVVDRDKLLELSPAIKKRVIREILKVLKEDYKDFYYKHIKAILDLVKDGQTGRQLDLPRNVIIKLNYNQLIFLLEEELEEIDYFKEKIGLGVSEIKRLNLQISSKVVDKSYPWRKWIDSSNKTCLDFSKVGNTFYIRQRQIGDRFYPLGMKGSKKIKDFMIDEKISLSKRDKVPIFTTLDDEIFWLGGLRVDDRFKVTSQTEKILMIQIFN